MKNVLRGAAASLVSLGMLAAGTFVTAHADAQMLPGDIDGSGTVDGADVRALAGFLRGDSESVPDCADLNGDGAVNAIDLTLLKRGLLPEPESACLLVYLVGANLESEFGEASVDIAEMQQAALTDGLTVSVLTGGATAWDTDLVQPDANYLLTFTDEGLRAERQPELRAMNSAATLQDFITQSVAAHPADHYGLVLWGHGAGPLFGFCYDEIAQQTMLLPALHDALEGAGTHFDFIGFDCCLMGNAETAYALKDYADYMIASVDAESGLGWEYEQFLNAWSADPAMPVPQLADVIIDNMIATNEAAGHPAALSCYDLSQAAPMMDALYDYIADVYAVSQADGIRTVLDARNRATDFTGEKYDIVDLKSMVTELQTAHSADVLAAMDKLIVRAESSDAGEICGLTMWFFERYPQDGVYLLDFALSPVGISAQYIQQMTEMSQAALDLSVEPA